jgi:hypothetical protein
VGLVEMMILYHKNYFFTVGSGQFAVTSGFGSHILPKKTQKASNLCAFGASTKHERSELAKQRISIRKIKNAAISYLLFHNFIFIKKSCKQNFSYPQPCFL